MMLTPAVLNERMASLFPGLAGIGITEASPERVAATLEVPRTSVPSAGCFRSAEGRLCAVVTQTQLVLDGLTESRAGP